MFLPCVIAEHVFDPFITVRGGDMSHQLNFLIQQRIRSHTLMSYAILFSGVPFSPAGE